MNRLITWESRVGGHAMLHRIIAAIAVIAFIGPLAAHPTPAAAVGSYDNAAIADYALARVGQWGGQCRQFVNDVVWAVSGGTQSIGGGNGAFPNLAANGIEITDINALVKGDVVQFENSPQFAWLHTFIIVSRVSGNTFNVVDSNWDVGSGNNEIIHAHQINFTLDPATRRAFRFGAVGSTGSTGNFALLSMQVGHLEIFRRDPSGAANHRWWDGGASWYGAWDSLGITIAGAPSVVSWGPDRQDVFIHGTDGAINWQTWTRSGGRSSWKYMNGTTNNDMAVFSLQPNSLEMVIRGTDGVMYHNWSDDAGATWSGWQSLGINILGTPAVITTGPDRQDLFVRGTDNVVYHQTWTRTGGRTNWTSMNGTTYDDIAVVSPQPGHLVAFVRGTDGYLYHSWSTDAGVTWSAWQGLGHKLLGKPAVVSSAPDRTDVVVRGDDDVMYHLAYTSSGWGAWESLGGQTKFAPQVLSWGKGRLDVFHLGTDGNFYHMWWAGAVQSAWYQVGTYQYVLPQVALSPLQVVGGGIMQESGSGFTPNGQLRMSIRLPNGTYYEQALQADANGSFGYPYTTPTNAQFGHYAYHIQDLTSGLWSNTVEFDVLTGGTPTVSVSPVSGSWGTLFHQPGAGFTANGQVTLEFTYPDGSLHISTVTADASGNYINDYTMPAMALIGQYRYRALDLTKNTWSTPVTFTVAQPQLFSIAGQVRDSSGSNLAGVSVSNGVNSAVTDLNGRYMFLNLQASSYTLTPTKSGCTFTPMSRAITVPLDTSDQNFTATCSGAPTPNLPPNRPTLLSPTNGSTATTTTPTFTWQDGGDPDNGPQATRTFRVSLFGLDGTVVATSDWLSGTSWTPPALQAGTYQWQVKAFDGATESALTAAWNLTIATGSTPPAPYFTSDYTVGKPGSAFVFTAGNLPAGASATIAIRRPGMSDFITRASVAVPTGGTLVFVLDIEASAAPGVYTVRITVGGAQPSDTTARTQAVLTLEQPLTIAAAADLHTDPPPTGVPVFTFSNKVYLPLLLR